MTTDDAAIPLPGLEAPAIRPGTLESAVRRTLAALPVDQLGEPQAARMALALELAQVITAKRASGRMSTIGNDARVLVELLDQLVPAPTDAGSDADEQLRKALERWGDELERDAAEQAAAVGDAMRERGREINRAIGDEHP